MLVSSEHDGILTLRLQHGKASALDMELCSALSDALRNAASAPETGSDAVRAVVLTGSGNIFCAGVDLFRVLDGGADYVRAFLPALTDLLRQAFTFPKPLIVAANGHAIAGGCLLVLCGDRRLMAEGGGRIGIPELLVGVTFPATAFGVARWALPAERIQRLVYEGFTPSASAAVEWGLVDEVTPADQLEARAMHAALELARIPGASFRRAKVQLRGDALAALDKSAAETDAATLAAWCDPATHERIREYLARTVRR